MHHHIQLLTNNFASDFAGLAGLTISTAGTLMLAGEVAKAIRGVNTQPRHRSSSRGKKR